MLDHLDPRIGHNFIDANVLDRSGSREAAAVDEILRLHELGHHDFRLLLPYSVKAEIANSHTPADVKLRAAHMIYSIQVQLTGPEMETLGKVRTLIQGNAKPGRHDRDAFPLVESAKYGGRHFITNDGRLLKKANQIWEMLQLKVLTPSDWLATYKAHAWEEGQQDAEQRQQPR